MALISVFWLRILPLLRTQYRFLTVVLSGRQQQVYAKPKDAIAPEMKARWNTAYDARVISKRDFERARFAEQPNQTPPNTRLKREANQAGGLQKKARNKTVQRETGKVKSVICFSREESDTLHEQPMQQNPKRGTQTKHTQV